MDLSLSKEVLTSELNFFGSFSLSLFHSISCNVASRSSQLLKSRLQPELSGLSLWRWDAQIL